MFNDGVRAELLGHLVDTQGSLCDNALNSRLVSLPLDEARQIPVRIGVATGKDKVEPVRAALNGGHISTLVIDDLTAQPVLSEWASMSGLVKFAAAPRGRCRRCEEMLREQKRHLQKSEKSASCEFADVEILHLQRMAGSTGCVAASPTDSHRQLRAGR